MHVCTQKMGNTIPKTGSAKNASRPILELAISIGQITLINSHRRNRILVPSAKITKASTRTTFALVVSYLLRNLLRKCCSLFPYFIHHLCSEIFFTLACLHKDINYCQLLEFTLLITSKESLNCKIRNLFTGNLFTNKISSYSRTVFEVTFCLGF